MTRTPRFDPEVFDLGPPDVSLTLRDDAATRALGAALAAHLAPGTFIGLVGHLGAGKTTLVQGLTAALTPTVQATSPTYTLVNLYPSTPPVIHIDLYRLERFDDLESIGYWDYAEDEDALICVEWISLLPGAWPGLGVLLEIAREGEGRRVRGWAVGEAAGRGLAGAAGALG